MTWLWPDDRPGTTWESLSAHATGRPPLIRSAMKVQSHRSLPRIRTMRTVPSLGTANIPGSGAEGLCARGGIRRCEVGPQCHLSRVGAKVSGSENTHADRTVQLRHLPHAAAHPSSPREATDRQQTIDPHEAFDRTFEAGPGGGYDANAEFARLTGCGGGVRRPENHWRSRGVSLRIIDDGARCPRMDAREKGIRCGLIRPRPELPPQL